MPLPDPPSESPKIDGTSSTTPTMNKEAKGNDKIQATKLPAAAVSTSTPKLSGAELKAQQKAEKAARRQQQVQARQAGPATPAHLPGAGGKSLSQQAQSQRNKGESGPGQHKRTVSNVTDVKKLPLRGTQPIAAHTQEPKVEDKTVDLFRHLYKARVTTVAGASKEVHPAVLALGLQMSNYTICGSNARLVATLQAFKRVIESYTTPIGTTMPRHLTSHVLSPQIDYLASCRPLSVSMGTAIRWLKLKISKVDIDESDTTAKEFLCEAIDEYIRDRVTLADTVIAKTASGQCIKNDDVILTFANSSIVQQTLATAHDEGRKFRVIVVDSRPLFEGKALARRLVDTGIEVKYCLMNGLSHCVRDATKVLLGAHAMMSNGRLFSRIGTAQVAMEANDYDIPVIVLCESIKCTERVALDSVVLNEVAPPDELLSTPIKSTDTGGALDGWRETKNLQLLNLMYDVTPADYIAMIVTELGIVPPSSIPVLQRLANETQ